MSIADKTAGKKITMLYPDIESCATVSSYGNAPKATYLR
jgi:hypothetical protein